MQFLRIGYSVLPITLAILKINNAKCYWIAYLLFVWLWAM